MNSVGTIGDIGREGCPQFHDRGVGVNKEIERILSTCQYDKGPCTACFQ